MVFLLSESSDCGVVSSPLGAMFLAGCANAILDLTGLTMGFRSPLWDAARGDFGSRMEFIVPRDLERGERAVVGGGVSWVSSGLGA